jgi:hypothetical protein
MRSRSEKDVSSLLTMGKFTHKPACLKAKGREKHPGPIIPLRKLIKVKWALKMFR